MHVKMSLVSIKLIDVTKGELLVSSLIQGYLNFLMKLDIKYRFTSLMNIISFDVEIRGRFTMMVFKRNFYVQHKQE